MSSSNRFPSRGTEFDGLTEEGRLLHYGWTITDSGCWEFDGPRNVRGYGEFSTQGRSRLAHRVSYQFSVGEFSGLLRHDCDNPPCVNPDHLIPGTHKDNSDDKMSRGRFRPVRGEMNGNARLTESQVKAIRSQARVASRQAVALEFGVSKSTVTQIVNRKTWKEVSDDA